MSRPPRGFFNPTKAYQKRRERQYQRQFGGELPSNWRLCLLYVLARAALRPPPDALFQDSSALLQVTAQDCWPSERERRLYIRLKEQFNLPSTPTIDSLPSLLSTIVPHETRKALLDMAKVDELAIRDSTCHHCWQPLKPLDRVFGLPGCIFGVSTLYIHTHFHLIY
jgi:hypothetical protein